MFKLQEDGSNWAIYENRAQAQLFSLGLSRHLRGSIPAPVKIVRHEGEWYLPTDTSFERPLSPEKVDAYEDKLQEYLVKEERGTVILADSLPPLIYSRIMRLPTLHDKWNRLCSMFTTDKYRLVKHVRNELSSTIYEDGPMLPHIWRMEELRDQLSDLGRDVSMVDFLEFLAQSLHGEPSLQRGIYKMMADEHVGRTAPLDMERVRQYLVNCSRYERALHLDDQSR